MSSALPFFNSRSRIRELIAVIATYYAGRYAASSGWGTAGPGLVDPSCAGGRGARRGVPGRGEQPASPPAASTIARLSLLNRRDGAPIRAPPGPGARGRRRTEGRALLPGAEIRQG